MIRYLFDENTHGSLPDAVARCALRSGMPAVDAVRVGDDDGPPHGTPDPDLLVWAADTGRVIVTGDYQTMPGFLADLLATGRTSPGMLLIRQGRSLADVAESLVTIDHASVPGEYADRIAWIPL